MSELFSWQTLVLVTYAGLLLPLSIVAMHRLWLAYKGRNPMVPCRARHPVSISDHPTVLIQLPLYNERYVAARLLRAVGKLRYPRSQLCVQVLDDSTDDTSKILYPVVTALRRDGLNIEYIRRETRQGFKAGALAAGLKRSTADLVAVFDADFVPHESFLEDLWPEFGAEDVGMVQARWGHLNRMHNSLTRAQGALLDGHFLNEHAGRAASGCYFNFNGTAGIWRRACIDDAGGWLARTITEDLDLSYRAQLKGWRFVFRGDVVVPAELPADTEAFKSQQHRWAKGSIEVARFLLPMIWREKRIGLRRQMEATFHLLGNVAYPLVILVALLLPLVLLARPIDAPWWNDLIDLSLLCGATLSLVFFYYVALRRAGQAGLCTLTSLPLALAVGAGLAVNNTRGLIEAMFGKPSEFVRTPKLGDADQENTHSAMNHGYLTLLRGMPQAIVEVAFGLHLLIGFGVAVSFGHYLALPFVGLFATGFLLLGVGSIWRARMVWLQRATPRTASSR